MKLLQRTGFYFMGFSLLILLVGGISIFYGLAYMIDHEMDESLHHTRSILHKELSKMVELPPVVEIMDEVIDIREIPELTNVEIYKDTLRVVDDEGELEEETFRQYIYTEKINGKNYRIALNHSKFGSEHLLVVITSFVLGFLFLFFLVLNLFNRFLSQQLWRPFYHTIAQIRHFSFAQPDKISALPTNIDEFKTLDDALAKMTEKLSKDYQSLKQFAENASHELQTPLAVILSQIELLLQREQDKENIQHLSQIQIATSKISKLNKSLLLLTRIENRQYEHQEDIAIDKILLQKLTAFELLISAKSIKVQKEITPVSLNANPTLIDVIISNLLSNAIRHNIEYGKIQIHLKAESLVIKNTGHSTKKPTTELFERFQKSDDAGKTLGLGLAIVKEICDLYAWEVDYSNEGQWHELKIKFAR